MSFQVYFHKCEQQMQEEVLRTVTEYRNNHFELRLKTSGSTGIPKEIIHSRSKVQASALRTNTFFKLTKDSIVLCPLMIHTIGAKMALFRAIEGDYTIHFVQASRTFIEDVPAHLRFDLVSLAPIQLDFLIENNRNELKRFDQILLGGASVSSSSEQLCLLHHPRTYIGFGMTETVSHFAIRKLGEEYYRCLDDISIFNRESGAEIRFNNESVYSTDIIETSDNKQFKFIGRSDFAINSGGIKFIPELIESTVANAIGLKVVAIGLPDKTLGEKLVIVTENDIDASIQEKINQVLNGVFGKYAVPKSFVTHSFETLNGLKLNRRSLIEQLTKHD